ncbi:MAG: T9SS type A sorting domain-containing protein [Bacteroidia bacterium]|nr:T9SS type A sorting domain-containing protein [Bacteroidia bacterium]
MNKRGYFLGGLFTLFLIFITGTSAKAQNSSARLIMGSLEAFPEVINDTSTYSFDIPIVNGDALNSLTVPVSLYMSVDGGPALSLLTNYHLPTPLLPGDTVFLPVNDYLFDAMRFTGGGITHDIIVWPMAMGVISHDSSSKTVIFNHTLANLSHKLGVEEPMPISGIIIEGTSYSFDLSVVNLDSVHDFIHPVTLMLSVNGDAPTVLVSDVSPDSAVPPGGSFEVSIDDYLFDAARFGGGGITHDIIVWPMAFGVSLADSAIASVSFIWELSVGPATETQGSGSDNDYGFVAEPGTPGVTLSWETGYEKPGTTFEIEKADLITGIFTGKGIIPGKGNYEMGSVYSITDPLPHRGVNLYQLVVHTPTGGIFVVATASAEWQPQPLAPSGKQVFVYNNPVDQNLVLSVPMTRSGIIRLSVCDQTGREIWTSMVEGNMGQNTVKADLSDKAAGIYIYHLFYDGRKEEGKVLKR